MIVFNVFIFLFSISIGLLVPLSILPKLSAIGILLLIMGLAVSVYGAPRKIGAFSKEYFVENINFSNLHVPALAIFLLFLLLASRCFADGVNIMTNMAVVILHVVFLIFIVNTRGYLFTYIRAYVILAFIMSFFGVISDLFLLFNIVEPNVDYVNISEMTNNAFTRDVNVSKSYIFPYNLGFILVGSGKLSFLGLEFYRISGWAHEPTTASFFVMPSMILLFQGNIIKNVCARFIMFLTILMFWILAASVGSLISIVVITSFIIVYELYTKFFPFKLSTFLIASSFCCVLLISYNPGIIVESTIFTSKFDFSSHTLQTAIKALTWFMPRIENDLVHYISFMFIWSIIIYFSFVILMSLYLQKELSAYIVILAYILLHSMKGSQSSIYTLVFTFFWFYVAYFSVYYKVDKLNLLLIKSVKL